MPDDSFDAEETSSQLIELATSLAAVARAIEDARASGRANLTDLVNRANAAVFARVDFLVGLDHSVHQAIQVVAALATRLAIDKVAIMSECADLLRLGRGEASVLSLSYTSISPENRDATDLMRAAEASIAATGDTNSDPAFNELLTEVARLHPGNLQPIIESLVDAIVTRAALRSSWQA